ncbi:hypothetical protein KCP77_02925 [Salmonella enterica subsp. enterica]|nr:hypothetical protein KCP77_02925 [Salmonella enterica subsp. enterica]
MDEKYHYAIPLSEERYWHEAIVRDVYLPPRKLWVAGGKWTTEGFVGVLEPVLSGRYLSPPTLRHTALASATEYVQQRFPL